MFGKWILRYTPWWVFALMLPIMVPLSINSVQDHIALRSSLDAAKSAPAPDVFDVGALALSPAREDPTEIAVLGQFRGRVGDIEAGKIDFAFALLEPKEADGPAVALVSEGYLFDLMIERISEAQIDGGQSLIRGFEEKDHRFRRKIEQSLKEAGWTRPIYVVEPYWGTRADALEGRLGSNRLFLIIAVGFTFLFALIMVIKLGGWFKRLQATRQEVRIPDANPLGQSETKRDQQSTDAQSVVRRRR